MEPYEDDEIRANRPPRPFESTRSEAEATLREADEATEDVKRRVKARLHDAKERLSGAYERSTDAATRAYNRAMDYSRENPRTATLVALGAGFGMGVLCGVAMPTRNRYRRLLPAVATALADAVLDVFDRR